MSIRKEIYKCSLCNSNRQEIKINEKYEKILVYSCFDVNCLNNGKFIKNLGVSLKLKLKNENK